MKSLKALLVICVFVAAAVAVFDSAKKGFATDSAAPMSAVSTLVNDLGGLARIKLDGSPISRLLGASETYQVKLGTTGIIFFKGEDYKFQAAEKEMLLSAILESAVKQTPKEEVATTPVPAPKKKTVFVNNADGLVRVKIGYGSFPVVSGDAMEVTQGDSIVVSDETQSKTLTVGDQPIGAAQVLDGFAEPVAYGALYNDAEETVFVSVAGNALAKSLVAGASRYFASGANVTVRFKNGESKSVSIVHGALVSDLIGRPQGIAAAVSIPVPVVDPHKSLAVTKIVNNTGFMVRIRQTNQYVANAVSDGGVMEFRRGEQIEVVSDGLSPTKITLSASEVYLMRDGDAIVAVTKVN